MTKWRLFWIESFDAPLLPDPVQVSLVAELTIYQGLLEYVADRHSEYGAILSCHIPVASEGAEWDEGRWRKSSIISIQNMWGVVAYSTSMRVVCKWFIQFLMYNTTFTLIINELLQIFTIFILQTGCQFCP